MGAVFDNNGRIAGISILSVCAEFEETYGVWLIKHFWSGNAEGMVSNVKLRCMRLHDGTNEELSTQSRWTLSEERRRPDYITRVRRDSLIGLLICGLAQEGEGCKSGSAREHFVEHTAGTALKDAYL